MKKALFLISLGAFNLLHGLMHIIQVIQSIFLIGYSTEVFHNNITDYILHSPIFSIIWAIIGITTIVIGVRDFKHHKHCE